MSKRAWLALVGSLGCATLVAVAAGVSGVGYVINEVGESRRVAPAVDYAVPTESEVEEWGRRLESAIPERVDVAATLFDDRAMAARAMPDGLSTDGQRRVIHQCAGALGAGGLQAGIRDSLSDGGDYSFRGVASRDQRPVARFRLLPVAGGVAFHDYVVGRRADGEVFGIDLHSLNTGEYLSATIGAGFETTVASEPDLLSKLRGVRNELNSELPKLARMQDLVRDGQPEEALTVYESLSETSQSQFLFALARVQAAGQLGDDPRYLEALDDLEARFPDHPGANALLLDAHIMRRDWEASRKALAVLDAEYPDAIWEATLARILFDAGDLPEARAVAARAVAAEPGLLDAQDTRLVVALALGDYDESDAALRILINDFSIDPVILSAQPGYERLPELASYQEYVALQ